jgi:hypothetical protein
MRRLFPTSILNPEGTDNLNDGLPSKSRYKWITISPTIHVIVSKLRLHVWITVFRMIGADALSWCKKVPDEKRSLKVNK